MDGFGHDIPDYLSSAFEISRVIKGDVAKGV